MKPSNDYTVNISRTRFFTFGAEIVPGYTLTQSYRFVDGDYISVFVVVETATSKPFVYSSSFQTLVEVLVEQLGVLTCEKAKLIVVNRN